MEEKSQTDQKGYSNVIKLVRKEAHERDNGSQKGQKELIVDWIKAHRTELAIASVTIVGTVLVVKNLDTIKGLFKNIGLTTPKLVEVEPVIEKVAAPVLSSDILDNLTGNELTARALGDKVWCSAQEINKRIVAAGNVIKLVRKEAHERDNGSQKGQKE